jgi:hypothetical protein
MSYEYDINILIPFLACILPIAGFACASCVVSCSTRSYVQTLRDEVTFIRTAVSRHVHEHIMRQYSPPPLFEPPRNLYSSAPYINAPLPPSVMNTSSPQPPSHTYYNTETPEPTAPSF